MTISAAKLAQSLGGRKTLGKNVRSELELHDIVAQGLPAVILESLVKNKLISRKQADSIVPRRTAGRHRASGKRLNAEQSERIARVVRTVEYANEVFGSESKARDWLHTTNAALDGKRPIDLATTETGGRIVETILTRIDYGVYS
ncbi:MAG: DUF2384 domain-containing protein [Candidatus Eremiobacteraeota bacterium]|nr:DUF2384 domain-containing protein [Candidatus Eremiobacteraeota bacterium]